LATFEFLSRITRFGSLARARREPEAATATHAAADRVERALRGRIARPSDRAANRRARFVFDAGSAGAWTVDFEGGGGGGVSLARGKGARPDATVYADAATLVEVLDGRMAGVEAFLEGRLLLRGHIALTMELDDLLHPPERDPRAPRCHRVTAADVDTFYLEAGQRGMPPAILLHGLGATSASFLPMMWDLSRDHHVFVPDLPGFGESDKPLRRLRPAFFARWSAGFLDAVALERAFVVGNSMGGRVALELGLRAPGRVRALALLAPSMAWRRYRAAAGLVQLLRPELAALPLPVLHRFVVRFIKGLFARPGRVPEAAINAAADEFVRFFASARGRIAFFHAAREIYLESPHGVNGFWDRLPGLEPPALFLFGDKDRLVPRAFGRHVRRALPSAVCETFHDCGHILQFERPALVSERVRSFFASVALPVASGTP
jgi:pimeloyl-ACP methyl ester carboxylesterase